MRISKCFFALCILTTAFLCAQQDNKTTTVYTTLKNIPYRDHASATDLESVNYMRERCRLDLYHPQQIKNFSTVVWFHGGGLKAGNRTIPAGLKKQGIAVVAVNYRLSPRVTSPAWIEDTAAAVAWTLKNIENYGGSSKKVFVSGHSAGGYLTSMVGLDKRWLAAHDIDANQIAGLIPYSGHAITHFTVRAEHGIDAKQPVVNELAPLYHVRQDAPPLLLITGDRELEMLGRYEENAYLWRMMKVAGHPATELRELKGYNHGQMAKPAHPFLLKFIAKINQKSANRPLAPTIKQTNK